MPCRTRRRRWRLVRGSSWCRRTARPANSADYISTQPRALKDPAAFWTAEVTKMSKVYGAPIEATDVPKIVDYLVATYNK